MLQPARLVMLNVAVPPTARSTEALMFPAPLVGQDDPTEAVQLQAAPVNTAQLVSLTVAPVTGVGPLFVATMV